MTSNPMHIADDQFCLYIFMLVELSDTLSPMQSHSEIAALLSAVGGFSYLIMWIRVTDLCTSQLQHYLVRWAALVT